MKYRHIIIYKYTYQFTSHCRNIIYCLQREKSRKCIYKCNDTNNCIACV